MTHSLNDEAMADLVDVLVEYGTAIGALSQFDSTLFAVTEDLNVDASPSGDNETLIREKRHLLQQATLAEARVLGNPKAATLVRDHKARVVKRVADLMSEMASGSANTVVVADETE